MQEKLAKMTLPKTATEAEKKVFAAL